jgi:metal-responsive CopG/Arc/MetJ family transcriptional regulator
MLTKKFAISIPVSVMQQVDLAARRQGFTRSRFIANVLRRVADARRDAEITRRINELFADPDLETEQKQTAREFNSSAAAVGTEW